MPQRGIVEFSIIKKMRNFKRDGKSMPISIIGKMYGEPKRKGVTSNWNETNKFIGKFGWDGIGFIKKCSQKNLVYITTKEGDLFVEKEEERYIV